MVFDFLHNYNLDKCYFSGPQGDQEGENQKAAEEIANTNWQTEQSLCDEEMVGWETADCPGLNCCVGNCNGENQIEKKNMIFKTWIIIGPHDADGVLVTDPNDPQSQVPYCLPPCTCGTAKDLDSVLN